MASYMIFIYYEPLLAKKQQKCKTVRENMSEAKSLIGFVLYFARSSRSFLYGGGSPPESGSTLLIGGYNVTKFIQIRNHH